MNSILRHVTFPIEALGYLWYIIVRIPWHRGQTAAYKTVFLSKND